MEPAVTGNGDETTKSRAKERLIDKLLHLIRILEGSIDVPGLMACVRSAVRDIVRADGATLVLREGNQVYYADEDAIGPLWKGRHFPIEQCVSGISMRDREQIAIEDVYADPRVPQEAYRGTFVKSVVLTPVGRHAAVGVVGAYWARRRRASARELALLQVLADCVSLALKNIKAGEEMRQLRFAAETEAVELASLYRRAEREIAGLKQAERTLRFLDLLFEGSPSLIAIVDLDYCFEQVNPAFAAVFGLSREKVAGKHAAEVLGADSFETFAKTHLSRCFAGDRVEVEAWVDLKGAGMRYLLASYFPLRLDDRVTGAAVIARDMTALQERNAELRRSQEQLRSLSDRLMTAQEEERRRLARDLHDGLNQAVAAAAIDLEKLALNLPDSSDTLRHHMKLLGTQLAEISEMTRDLAHGLHPPALEHLGLRTALETLCGEFSRREGIPVRFTVRGLPGTVPPGLSLALYRVAQECLRNVARHSHARHAWVSLGAGGSEIRLSIRDDGAGILPKEAGHRGLGLQSIEERMRLAGGRLRVKSRPGGGTQVVATVPLPEDAR